MTSLLLTLWLAGSAPATDAALSIGSQRQLFLDDLVVERSENLVRRVCPARKHPDNPLIARKSDNEPPRYLLYGSVLYDEQEKLFKAWCDANDRVCYFTSRDGIHWRVPGVCVAGKDDPDKRWSMFLEHFGVTKDLRDPDPARRYKMGFMYLDRQYKGPHEAPFHPGQERGLGVAFSPDGVRWTLAPDQPATHATCDGQTHWFYDESKSRWVLYGRTRFISPELRAKHEANPNFKHNWGRAVARAESPDFVHWTPNDGQLVLAADAEDGPLDEIYSMGVFPYEGVYIGLVQVFHDNPDHVWLDIQLAVSRDSVHFQRLSDRSPFIPVGGVGDWDRFNNSVANSRPIAVGDELRFYYSGRNLVHPGPFRQADDGRRADLPWQGAVGLATIARDRFAAMEATFVPGTLRTKPLRLAGRRLHVNAAFRFGTLRVALVVDGKQIEQVSLAPQDALDIAVPLEKLGAAADQPVQFEFTLINGRLFSFWVD